jgi:hypothetical protein
MKSQSRTAAGSTLDILIFEDDRLRRLDSYQRFEGFTGNSVAPASTGGDKIFLLCMNAQRNRYDWADISSYSSLDKICCDLEKERRERPVMTGECRGRAGEEITIDGMTPLRSEVTIERLRRDFSGTPYEREGITEVKAYLTNVNASCPLSAKGHTGTSRLINAGMYNPHDAKAFKDPSMVMQEISREIEFNEAKTEKSFICYPNQNDRSRSTRLVIEGKIGSETYYWPIEVGDGSVERNSIYKYDILIRRKGTTDPDRIIDPVALDITLNIKPWTEKEEYQVGF